MGESKLIPKITFKGVFVFMIILFIGMLCLPIPLQIFPISKKINYFISAGISASIGLSLVVTIIDGKKDEKAYLKHRIIISTIVGFAASALMILVFGGDILD